MPYDSRPVSQGGNCGIDETFSRQAPPGKYRIVGVDTFDGTDWLEGDFKDLQRAKQHAEKRGGTMLKMHVYDDRGRHVYDAGTF